MHKRNKKNKHKNPTPPQQPTAPAEPVKESENVEKEEERVPEIIPEASTIESNAVQDTPAKPKRHRAGKKKKNENKEDENEPSDDKAVEEEKIEVKESEKEKIVAGSKEEIQPAKPATKMSVHKPSHEENFVRQENQKAVLKEAIIDKAVHQQIEDKTFEPPMVTPIARKKKGKQHKIEPEIPAEAIKDLPADTVNKEAIVTKTEVIEEKSIEKQLTEEIPIENVTPSTKVQILSSILDIKEREPLSDTSANEQKGGKKKNKKNQKSNTDSATIPVVPKTEHTIEMAEQQAEIKADPVKNEETKLEFEEIKTHASPKQEVTGKRERKIIIPAKDVLIEPAKMDEQKICDKKQEEPATMLTPTKSDYKSKLEEHEPDTPKGKKKNKKEKKNHNEKHDDNKNIEAIIEELPPESNPIKIIGEPSENIIVNEEFKKDEKPEAKTVIDFSLEDPITDAPITEIKEKKIEQDSPKIEISHADDQFLQQQMANSSASGDNNNNSLISKSSPAPEEIINNEFEKILSDTSPSEKSPQIVTLPEAEIKAAENVEADTQQFTLLSESNVDESCKKLFESLLITDKTAISHPTETLPVTDKTAISLITETINPPTETETKKGDDFLTRFFEQSLTPALLVRDMTAKDEKSESTDLKHKVMEVNKDMEDLQLSIEKSLAELTSLEADNMAEMVAITDYKTPLDKPKKEEVIKVANLECKILPVREQVISLRPASPAGRITEMITPIEIKKDEPETKPAEIPKKVNTDILTPQEVTIEPQHLKKGKGKGKLSKPQEPITLVNLELKEILPRSRSPAIDLNLAGTHVEECVITEPVMTAPIEADATKIIENKPDIQEHNTQTFSHDHKGKGKGKNKKKNKNVESVPLTSNVQGSQSQQTETQSSDSHKSETTKPSEGKTETKESDSQKGENTKKATDKDSNPTEDEPTVKKEVDKTDFQLEFDKAENFEAALIIDDENKMFEEISGKTPPESTSYVIPIENNDMLFDQKETKSLEEKQVENPICSHPKNLLGPPDIPVTSSKNDYKKEKNKNVQTPNAKQANIKVKDSVEIETESKKCSKQSQTENKIKSKRQSKSASPESDHEDEEFVYKYSFRKVFLTNSCNVCKAELKGRRLACGYCNLIFYCSQKHKDEEWPHHQALCFAVSTIVHLKGLKFIYGDAQGANGQDYRLLRMQVIVSCEKILKRKLLPCEQETLLYPRMCCEPTCREWKSGNLKDCDGCGLGFAPTGVYQPIQYFRPLIETIHKVSYCIENPQHLTREHQMWCKSYRLYFKLVTHQQNQGRLEPKLPSKVITDIEFKLPDKINELLAQVYEEKIDMDDVHYAALTQLATAPLTAAYTYQLYNTINYCHSISNGHQGKTFTLHVVGAELQFEADTLNKWEVFFLHLRPDVQELRVVFVGPELNPSKLPLDLLAKIKMCKQCRQDQRKILFDYQDGQLYHNYVAGKHFTRPDIVCAFNPGLHRITGFGGVDSWPDTISCIIDLKIPVCITSYTKHELPRDLLRIAECSRHQYKMILEPTLNPYASIRPDRNFISDDEMPLIFKNYYVMVLCGM